MNLRFLVFLDFYSKFAIESEETISYTVFISSIKKSSNTQYETSEIMLTMSTICYGLSPLSISCCKSAFMKILMVREIIHRVIITKKTSALLSKFLIGTCLK